VHSSSHDATIRWLWYANRRTSDGPNVKTRASQVGDTRPAVWPVPTLERTYPGHLDQGQQVRAELRSFLAGSPIADEVTAVAWELAANACLYSNSNRPGGQFALTVHDFTGDYVYAEVRDQGSIWDADLSQSAECPHGLYLMQQLATTYGAAGARRGWMIWFTVSYPPAPPVPALASRQVPTRPPGWCPPQWTPASPEILRRVRTALDQL
jgi:anti-sigma regulatory factor (Ser/Thr protein kinase)